VSGQNRVRSKVHRVLDDSSTDKTPAIQTWLAAHPRFVAYCMTTSSLWLNVVERWFAELTTQRLRGGAYRSIRELNADIRDWINAGATVHDRSSGPRPPTGSSTRSPLREPN
jgi:hypothetical protein